MSTKMNTIAKRKVEQIVSEEIARKIEAYKKKRRDELDAMVEQYEKEPSAKAKAIHKKIQDTKKEVEKLEEELKAAGFSYSYHGELTLRSTTRYGSDYRNSWQEYYVPQLTAHSKHTTDTVQKLEALGRNYTLKIWAGEASEEIDLLKGLETELSALLT